MLNISVLCITALAAEDYHSGSRADQKQDQNYRARAGDVFAKLVRIRLESHYDLAFPFRYDRSTKHPVCAEKLDRTAFSAWLIMSVTHFSIDSCRLYPRLPALRVIYLAEYCGAFCICAE